GFVRSEGRSLFNLMEWAIGFWERRGRDRCLMWRGRRSGFVGIEGRSLLVFGLRGSGCVGIGGRSGCVGEERRADLWVMKGRSLFDGGNRRSGLCVVRGDRCLI
ncbi:MAG: hypothetical protein ACK5V6_13620, partial [Pseudanabaena sp.]